MTIQLYDVPKSGHCHRVRLAASLMGLDVDLVSVMDMDGQRQGAAYLAINPLGQVPTLVDGDLTVRDSIAILQYLERTYAPDQGWMPTDRRERAQVDEWFAISAGVMFRGPNMARLIKLFKMPGDHDAAVAQSQKLFDLMEAHLQDRAWLVGARATLADIACYAYVAVANEGALDLTPYPNIAAWLARVQALDGFVDIPRS
ncbi:glutathione S-transferase family protein [Citreicella sp. C3M06]|uniref:glutathione S-transferase family protein n=1 Tax=Citreicella sp. C3M06 TaxID=2841564 RepID=UPI001C0A38DA|nr:glutathione S-transferase family protein [Citreicella sp. C3M06]MBU2961110.1 glutathione S-transferase family protein [Citreicella sp. C3M06]